MVRIMQFEGTPSAKTAVAANTSAGLFGFTAYDGTISQEIASIRAFTGATFGGSDTSGNLRFYTTNTSGAITERVRINESGNVGIGTTSPASDAKLAVNGAAQVAGTGSETCATAADLGKIRLNPATGRIQICRQ